MGGVLDIEKLIEAVGSDDKPAFAITEVDEIVAQLGKEMRSGDVVAVMSNGAFGGIHEKLLAVLA
jgi:UDP-N-acetylmuramate: L-alanyl-gamma-D-glutamyl-meso-diaminopimelate ligase